MTNFPSVSHTQCGLAKHWRYSRAALTLSHCCSWPLSQPRVNQRTRCVEEPCVKDSGVTVPRACAAAGRRRSRLRRSGLPRYRRPRGSAACGPHGAPRCRRDNRPAAPAAPRGRCPPPGSPFSAPRALPGRSPTGSARGGRPRARSRRPGRSHRAPRLVTNFVMRQMNLPRHPRIVPQIKVYQMPTSVRRARGSANSGSGHPHTSS